MFTFTTAATAAHISRDRVTHGQDSLGGYNCPFIVNTRNKKSQYAFFTRNSINMPSRISGYKSGTFLQTKNVSFLCRPEITERKQIPGR